MFAALNRTDLEFLLRNITKMARESMRFVDRHFPTEDQALADYLQEACNTPTIEALSGNVERFCTERWNDVEGMQDALETFRYVRNWLMTGRMLQTLATQLQIALPTVSPGSIYEQVLYTSRVMHDASVGCTQKVQVLLPLGVVATTYGLVEQGEAHRLEADRIRQELASGKRVDVFRIVSAYGNFLQWSPFWSIGTPLPDSKQLELAWHAEQSRSLPYRLSGPAIIVQGRLNPTATFVLEPSHRPLVGQYASDTIITTFDGVEVDYNPDVQNYIRELTAPAKKR